jgi:hypothetical protein
MKKAAGEFTCATHDAEKGDRVSFHHQDPDYPKQQNKFEVYVQDGKLVVYCEHSPNITLQAANIVVFQGRRKA